MRIKTVFIIVLTGMLLLGCAGSEPVVQPAPQATEAPTAAPVTVQVSVGETTASTDAPTVPATDEPTAPADTPAPAKLTSADFPSVWVADGERYGTDLIVYVNGIGLAYELDGTKPSECTVEVETEAMFELPPYETHRLLLHVGEETFCLGELRWNVEDPKALGYFGERYEWIAMDSDLCDTEPEQIGFPGALRKDFWEAFDPSGIAFITGFDAEKHTIDVLTARQVENTEDDDALYAIDPDSIAEAPITLTVPENAQLTVTDEYAFMPVTRDRFFRLLESGYIGYLPTEDEDYFVGVYLGHKDGAVTYLYEDYLP